VKAVDTSFEDVSDEWRSHEDSVRGAIRYQLTRENIEIYLSDDPLQILDLGGGTGPDSAWFAEKGHNVVLVEPSAKNLVHAKKRFKKDLNKEQRGRIDVIHGDINSLSASKYKKAFDWVVSHGVAMYVEEPETYWQSAWKLLGRGGYFSLLESGYAATKNDLTMGGKQTAGALAQFMINRKYTNRMGHEARAFKFSEMEEIFKPLGAKVVMRAGVRFDDADKINSPLRDFNPRSYKKLLAEERILGHDPATMKRAQMLHLILKNKTAN
jgi:SAM-dependent methyltransferase